MALDPADLLRPAQSAEDTSRAPLGGTRSQAVQRLQIGMSGLAAMVLLVALANIVITNAQRNEARVVAEAAPSVADEPADEAASDPLADAGVVPELPTAPAPRNGNASPATR